MTDFRSTARVLIVTGSRRWIDGRVEDELSEALRAAVVEEAKGLLVVHGGCSTGADALASHWVRNHAFYKRVVDELVFPLNAFGGDSAARNWAMVKRNAEGATGIAFWDGSVRGSGTHQTMTYLAEHGVPFRVVPMERRRSMAAPRRELVEDD